MFDTLSTKELTVLQSMLFEGTEEAYKIIDLRRSDPGWFGFYHPVHCEVGGLFIEVGTELLQRLDQSINAEAA